MASTLRWYSQPIFISSTFTDMMAERDHLRDFVFPELAERLRERRHFLEPVDLRWGVQTVSVSEQAEKELLVLKVCLDEIERCRPFLIALLGDRYGWIPPERRMKEAVDEKGFKTSVHGKSVTALEIEFGVLASRDQQNRSFFYFRKPLPYDLMDPKTAALYSDRHNPEADPDSATNLEALKQTILKTLGKDRVREYSAEWEGKQNRVTGLKDWGNRVLEDLWKELDEKTRTVISVSRSSTWQQEERDLLDAFVEERSRGFTGRETILVKLREIALSPPDSETWGVCVEAGPGTGKSALFAKLVRILEKEDFLVLAHAAGIGVRSTGLDALIRRWIQELAAFLKLKDADPSKDLRTMKDKEELFANLLSRAASLKRVVCLIDALNQLERTPTIRHMTWLPDSWPRNARLIVTAIPGDQTAALAKLRGVVQTVLDPMAADDAKEMIRTLCDQYHKAIHPDIVRGFLDKKNSKGNFSFGNPLWLRMAVEELLLLDEDDFAKTGSYSGTPEQQLHSLMADVINEMPPDVEGLYEYLFTRAEKRFGGKWVYAVIYLIAVSRWGLRESDLQSIVPDQAGEHWEPLKFAAFRRFFRAHLTQKGSRELWDYSHAQVRIGLDKGKLKKPELRKKLHQVLANHFYKLPPTDPLRQTEIMAHWIGADDNTSAATYYGDRNLSDSGLSGATKVLAEHVLSGAGKSPNPSLKWIAEWLSETTLNDEQKAIICNRLNFYLDDSIVNDGGLAVRMELLEPTKLTLEKLSKSDPGNSSWQRDLSVSYNKVGDVFSAQGDLSKALSSYQQFLSIAEKLSKSDPGNSEWQRDLSVSYENLGDVFRTQGDLSKALSSYQQSLSIREKLSKSDPGNSLWQHDLSVSYEKLGNVFIAQGDLSNALSSYQQSLSIIEKLSKSDPGNSSWQRNLSVSYDKVADVFRAQGDLSKALSVYQQSHAIFEKLSKSDPGNSSWQFDLGISNERLGDVFSEIGDLNKALIHYQTRQTIIEKLSNSDPGNSEWQRDLSVSYIKVGNMFHAQGDLSKALSVYKQSHAILEKLSKSDPGNSSWQCDLLVSYEKLGNVLIAQGDLSKALSVYQQSLSIAEKLSKSDPGNSQWQRSLYVSYYKLALVAEQGKDVSATQWWRKAYEKLNGMKIAGFFISPGDEKTLNFLRGKVTP